MDDQSFIFRETVLIDRGKEREMHDFYAFQIARWDVVCGGG